MKHFMRKILKKAVAVGCAVALTVSIVPAKAVSAKGIAKFSCKLEENLDNITLTWKAQSNVSYYKIYRVNYDALDHWPKKSEYTKIGTTTKTKYVDRMVKNGVRYAYFVKGVQTKNGKSKVVCTTYGRTSLGAAGLAKPWLKSSEFEGVRDITPKALYVYVETDYGMDPTGYILYRKEKGEKKYKKIKTVVDDSMDEFVTIKDGTVKGGKTYSYKVRSYFKQGGKTYYSKKSNAVKLRAVYSSANYTVKCLSEASVGKDTFTIMLKGKEKYNGNLVIRRSNSGAYYYEGDGKDIVYDATITRYSLDNKTWKKIPKKGFIVKGKKKVYLQVTLSGGLMEGPKEDIQVDEIYFGGTTAERSMLTFEAESDYEGGGVNYKGVVVGSKDPTDAYFNLTTGEGSVWLFD